MAFELTFVVALVTPLPVVIVLLGAGVAFHVGCAVLTGLNSFVWAFPATYACVWWATQRTSPWW